MKRALLWLGVLGSLPAAIVCFALALVMLFMGTPNEADFAAPVLALLSVAFVATFGMSLVWLRREMRQAATEPAASRPVTPPSPPPVLPEAGQDPE